MAAVATRIDRYELRRELASTATSTVYDGWDSALSRRVAVKIVNISRFSHAEVQNDLARFRQGARAAGRLVHPNIASVHDYGETDQRAYLVMEFIDGPTLQDLFDEGRRFDLDEVASIIGSVLQGLQYSHEQNIVHRDIKPGNIMFTADGTVKLTDFGIARIENSDVTVIGTIMGTPAYMSPEQFLGEKVDWRSDIYSVGVTLYHLLTGERPFEGSLTTIMHKVLYTTPPLPSRLSSVVNSALDAVVVRAMERYREDRFDTCDDFHAALQIALAQSRRSTRPVPSPDVAETVFRAERWQISTAPKPPVREPRFHLPSGISDLLADRTRAAIVAGCAAGAILAGAALAWLGTRESAHHEATPLPAVAILQSSPPIGRPEPPAAPVQSVAAPTAPGSAGPLENRTETTVGRAAVAQGQAATAEPPPTAEPGGARPVTVGPAAGPQGNVYKDDRRQGVGRAAEGPYSLSPPRDDPRTARGNGDSASIRPPAVRATPDGGSTLPPWLSKMAQNTGKGTGPPPPVSGAAKEADQPAPEFAYTSVSAPLGLVCRSVTAEAGANLGLESAKGMEVVGVTSGGAADRAGIRRNDVILSIAGVPMRDLSGVSKLADNLSERVPVELWREGKRQVVQLNLRR